MTIDRDLYSSIIDSRSKLSASQLHNRKQSAKKYTVNQRKAKDSYYLAPSALR